MVVAVGLAREARIVSGPCATVVTGGGQSARLASRIRRAIEDGGVAGIVSFGLCGALRPGLKPGDLIVQSDDPLWLRALHAALPEASLGQVTGGDVMVATTDAKQALHRASGADAVDMESHVVRSCAEAAGLPHAIVRSVSDAADRALPASAMAGMNADGGADVAAVLAALIRRPWELPALLRVAGEANRAFSALARAHAAVGPTLGCPGVGEAP